jgi:plastocyanin
MRALLKAVLPLLSVLLAGQAAAAELTVMVRATDGQPIHDAVASFTPAGGVPAGTPIHFPWPMVVAQENLQFTPFVLIAPVGADVTFPNRDKVRHHVYSFSPAKRFELKLYGKEETRSVHFDKAGTVALGCNIHDRMVGFIRVVATPYAGKTDGTGKAVLKDLPAGGGVLTVWYPYQKTRDGEISRTLASTASGQEAFTIELRPVER